MIKVDKKGLETINELLDVVLKAKGIHGVALLRKVEAELELQQPSKDVPVMLPETKDIKTSKTPKTKKD